MARLVQSVKDYDDSKNQLCHNSAKKKLSMLTIENSNLQLSSFTEPVLFVASDFCSLITDSHPQL